MSVNPAWVEPETKEAPKEVVEMAEVIKTSVSEYRATDINEGCMVIAERLIAAGYAKPDPGLLSFIDRLNHELKDFRESLGRIIEGTRLLKLTDEKAGQVLRMLEHAKNRQEGR